MENKKKSSKTKLKSKESVPPRQDCSSHEKTTGRSFKNRCQSNYDLKIKKKTCNQKPRQRVYVTIKPNSPAIKTIFLAEKSRFYSKKGSQKTRSILAIGDHLSFTSRVADNCSSFSSSYSEGKHLADRKLIEKSINLIKQEHKQVQVDQPNAYKAKRHRRRTCYSRTLPQITFMRHLKLNRNSKNTPQAEYPSNFVVAHSSLNKYRSISIAQIQRTINLLKRRVQRREMVFGATDSSSSLASDEGYRENMMSSRSTSTRPGCSYIEHYSHIPETSAFQRYAQESTALAANRGATVERGYNSEQYGRNFTAYDGITARARRQSASVTYKRDDQPRQAAEKVIKIRHKLHPVRDYRLMDTVHYLAQGEFAPRNDGIKLTPSREAVLSDIIWEDVCRTHWPSTRLGRRQQDRSATRYELQRLIDNLLRERIAHVERRRRRHYRTVKLSHRQENNVPPLGKTGDIIVASHKNKHDDDGVKVTHESSGAITSNQKWQEHNPHRSHRSQECLGTPESSRGRRVVEEECTPGPSYPVFRNRRPDLTFCCQAAGPSTQPQKLHKPKDLKKYISGTSTSSSEIKTRNPRLIIKKNSSRRKHLKKDGINLENLILLPTLVFRTPSNVNRQKKFNELYHRILSHLTPDENKAAESKRSGSPFSRNTPKKDSSMQEK